MSTVEVNVFRGGMYTTDASHQYPVKLEIELSDWEDLAGLVEFWRYIRNTANGGHSFSIEADRRDLGDRCPKVYIDGDGADKVGRIMLNGRDVTKG